MTTGAPARPGAGSAAFPGPAGRPSAKYFLRSVDKAGDKVDGRGQHYGPQQIGQERLAQHGGADGVGLQVRLVMEWPTKLRRSRPALSQFSWHFPTSAWPTKLRPDINFFGKNLNTLGAQLPGDVTSYSRTGTTTSPSSNAGSPTSSRTRTSGTHASHFLGTRCDL
ncbi:hypothetical protein AHiyo1_43030 [Arthrobacter sp. Hiyo1]|nr:hypothetical protein AHiyo1_43030 [Arthrobacter sp. Hiyo1]